MYTITDVPELAEWMRSKVALHPSFRPLTEEELEADVAAGLLVTSSEEGQKVERNSGQVNAFHDLASPLWPILRILCMSLCGLQAPGL